MITSAIYIYKKGGSGIWATHQVIQSTTTQDFYGWSVAMNGDQMISGAPRDDFDENGNNEMGDAGAAYILKDPNLLGTQFNNEMAHTITLYPNPSQEKVTVESTLNGLENIKVYSIDGSLLKDIKNVGNNMFTMDISAYSNGIYFVKITLEDGFLITKKILRN